MLILLSLPTPNQGETLRFVSMRLLPHNPSSKPSLTPLIFFLTAFITNTIATNCCHASSVVILLLSAKVVDVGAFLCVGQ
jgi:hypothetical protein